MDRIVAFRSHWAYRSDYCNPASGNEKGGRFELVPAQLAGARA
jgi:hypothetical protein